MNSRKIGGGFTFCWGWVGGRLGVGRIITGLMLLFVFHMISDRTFYIYFESVFKLVLPLYNLLFSTKFLTPNVYDSFRLFQKLCKLYSDEEPAS